MNKYQEDKKYLEKELKNYSRLHDLTLLNNMIKSKNTCELEVKSIKDLLDKRLLDINNKISNLLSSEVSSQNLLTDTLEKHQKEFVLLSNELDKLNEEFQEKQSIYNQAKLEYTKLSNEIREYKLRHDTENNIQIISKQKSEIKKAKVNKFRSFLNGNLSILFALFMLLVNVVVFGNMLSDPRKEFELANTFGDNEALYLNSAKQFYQPAIDKVKNSKIDNLRLELAQYLINNANKAQFRQQGVEELVLLANNKNIEANTLLAKLYVSSNNIESAKKYAFNLLILDNAKGKDFIYNEQNQLNLTESEKFILINSSSDLENRDIALLKATALSNNQEAINQYIALSPSDNSYELGSEFLNNKDTQGVGLQLIKNSVSLNNTTAILTLAQLYETGEIIQKDTSKAIELYTKLFEDSCNQFAENKLSNLLTTPQSKLRLADIYKKCNKSDVIKGSLHDLALTGNQAAIQQYTDGSRDKYIELSKEAFNADSYNSIGLYLLQQAAKINEKLNKSYHSETRNIYDFSYLVILGLAILVVLFSYLIFVQTTRTGYLLSRSDRQERNKFIFYFVVIIGVILSVGAYYIVSSSIELKIGATIKDLKKSPVKSLNGLSLNSNELVKKYMLLKSGQLSNNEYRYYIVDQVIAAHKVINYKFFMLKKTCNKSTSKTLINQEIAWSDYVDNTLSSYQDHNEKRTAEYILLLSRIKQLSSISNCTSVGSIANYQNNALADSVVNLTFDKFPDLSANLSGSYVKTKKVKITKTKAKTPRDNTLDNLDNYNALDN